MKEKRNEYDFLYKNLAGETDKSVDGKTVLKWVINKYDGIMWTLFNWFKVDTNGGFL
jgi:hypothetical protein